RESAPCARYQESSMLSLVASSAAPASAISATTACSATFATVPSSPAPFLFPLHLTCRRARPYELTARRPPPSRKRRGSALHRPAISHVPLLRGWATPVRGAVRGSPQALICITCLRAETRPEIRPTRLLNGPAHLGA